MMAQPSSFFSESTEQSRIKAAIVSRYFEVWAKIMVATHRRFPAMSNGRIAYIDLFAGPGRYLDGTVSTPLLVLQMAAKHPEIAEKLVVVFNDKDEKHCASLQRIIDESESTKVLKNKPVVRNSEVGEQIVKMFEEMRLIPTFFFVDPWGYKGLSLRLVNSVLKNWGCDCVFFFNYTRINMGLSNPKVQEHMTALFGEEAEKLGRALDLLSPSQRELTIIESLCRVLVDMGGKYTLPFRFRNEAGTRTSHHLIFVSKHFKGYEVMKGIMFDESSARQDGVASFEYNPADARQPMLFALTRSLEDLEGMLCRDFAGRTVTAGDIYMEHNVGTPFVKKNYKDVLLGLERKGAIRTEPARRGKGFADHVLVTFP